MQELKFPFVIWLYGLPSAGKTTISRYLVKKLMKFKKKIITLDGDELRTGINSDLGFSIDDRRENIRRTAEIAKILLNCNDIVICSLITPTEKFRGIVFDIIGRHKVLDIFVECPIEKCLERDVKGFYKKAIAGEIKQFTGIDSLFEKPKNVTIKINTDNHDLEFVTNEIVSFLIENLNEDIFKNTDQSHKV